jgi:uncharacterized protein (TIGR03437 family)
MRLFFATLVLAAPLCAQNCTFDVQPPTLNVPATASTGNKVTVTVSPSNCNQGWLVTASVSWLHITSPAGNGSNGSGTVVFSADANPSGVARSGSLTIANQQVTIAQAAAVCKFGVTPPSQNFGVAGGPGSFFVQANCSWGATNNSPQFISFPGANGIADSPAITFTVAANGCASGRTGSIQVNGSGLATPLLTTVTQDGSPANFSLSATGATLDAAAGDSRFTLNTGVGCGWSAFSDVTWLTLTSGASGSGNGAITYHAAANPSAARSGSIHVSSPPASLVYTVTQQAAASPVPQIASVNNAANYAADAISPGQIVTLFGQNMGPSPLVPLQVVGGSLTTNLAGTQVLFDGVAAPMIYSLQNQVSAIAPYGLAGKSSTAVQVKYNGTASNTVTMPVQPATPAIFTLDATGLGPGAILNQDFSTNGSGRPAARLSVVAIYCTGGGTTDPASADGSVIGSALPRLTLPVSVTIGGVDANVSYAGGVPGSVAGLIQINAEVPVAVRPGSGIPVTISIGGVSSTSGVTMSVN